MKIELAGHVFNVFIVHDDYGISISLRDSYGREIDRIDLEARKVPKTLWKLDKPKKF